MILLVPAGRRGVSVPPLIDSGGQAATMSELNCTGGRQSKQKLQVVSRSAKTHQHLVGPV